MGIVIMEFVQYSEISVFVSLLSPFFFLFFLEISLLFFFFGSRLCTLRDACKVPSTLMGEVKKKKKSKYP